MEPMLLSGDSSNREVSADGLRMTVVGVEEACECGEGWKMMVTRPARRRAANRLSMSE